jgi:hypothetical protein
MQGYTNETVHARLFNMPDEEFDKVMKMTDKEICELVKKERA